MGSKVFIHDMGMSLRDSIKEFSRILSTLRFEVREEMIGESARIIAKRGEIIVELILKPEEPKLLSISRTIVEIRCSESIHDEIQRRIRILRCGG